MNVPLPNLPPELTERLDTDKMGKLQAFASLIIDYNRRINLISRKDIGKIWENHILPSIIVDWILNIEPRAIVVDVGTGAGLPGVPLKIIRPDLRMTLIDSVRKKTLFLKKATAILDLSDITVINTRIDRDSASIPLSHKFSILTVRGVSSIYNLINKFSFLLKPDGYMLIWKGERDLSELHELKIKLNFDYEIYSPPSGFTPHSQKVESLRIIKLNPFLV
jgi:16S rRNA (guanine527-N7)-methyltransferase